MDIGPGSNSGPTVRGRFWAVTLGVVMAGAATMYMMKDFQLVRRLDDPNEEPKRRPFRVSFQPSEKLELRQEAQEQLELMRPKIQERKEKNERN